MSTSAGQQIPRSVFPNLQAATSGKAAGSSRQQTQTTPNYTMDSDAKFTTAKLRLSALLDALQCVNMAGQASRNNGETMYSLVSMAEDYAEELGEIFEQRTSQEVAR